jgi:hypothetical protein
MSWNIVRINLPFQQRWIKTTLKVDKLAFSSVYNLITLASLDVTFLRLWTV